ncbi:7TM-DISM domain-containing protein [Craterilacuibacter sinensis]|uniref:7TM-DISM receptor extracellular domain-containing protein n=1 Tax=Craterilacuibacter sinensis TaxID=2686017 RepID=A0A845BQ57_9NEIS|nr:7TM-DISM domain-containing protein [Craterilacuibacter sinensis]MXR37298.1 hypothetical protein [Craterilacuibacter sinensis]
MQLNTPSELVAGVGREQLLFGVFYAIHLVLLVSSSWFWLRTRSQPFALFGLCVLANLACMLNAEGHGLLYLLPGQAGLFEDLFIISWFAITPLNTLFTCHYLGLYRGRWRRIALGASALCIAIALLATPWLPLVNVVWLRSAYFVWTILINLLLLLVSRWQLAHGNRAAHALVLVLVLVLQQGGACLRLARNIGAIEPGLLADNAHYLGMMAFFLIMNSAITLRYTDLRAEKEAAQAEALKVAREAESRLGQEVAARTAELRGAMEQVETALLLERHAQQQQQYASHMFIHISIAPICIASQSALHIKNRPGREAGRFFPDANAYAFSSLAR